MIRQDYVYFWANMRDHFSIKVVRFVRLSSVVDKSQSSQDEVLLHSPLCGRALYSGQLFGKRYVHFITYLWIIYKYLFLILRILDVVDRAATTRKPLCTGGPGGTCNSSVYCLNACKHYPGCTTGVCINPGKPGSYCSCSWID